MDSSKETLVSGYRADIDGLRAVAILSVVAYHSFPKFIAAGFVGVDIFFVISGYLISSIIVRGLKSGRFSFKTFYVRRIARIFPALAVVLATSLLFGGFVLLPSEYKQLGKHVIGAVGFVSNFVLWGEAGYFDVLSRFKPLLHLWSLGIEEQFYLIWPLLLYFAYKYRVRLIYFVLILGSISFLTNIILVDGDRASLYYLPVTRFWELLLGSTLVCFRGTYSAPLFYKHVNFYSFIGFILIISSIFLLNKDLAFPGWWALLPTVGTFLIISSGANAWINRKLLSAKLLVWFGLISYPLYLWHWPLLTYLRITRLEPSSKEKLVAVGLSVLLAWITYRLVESPIRFGRDKTNKSKVLLIALFSVGAVGYYVYLRDGFILRSPNIYVKQQLEWNWWDDAKCASKYGGSPCQASSAPPKVLLLGDSFANQFFPGLSAIAGDAFPVLSSGSCPPLYGLSVGRRNSAYSCLDVQSNNLKALRNYPSIQTVIIIFNWQSVLDPNGDIILKSKNRYADGMLRRDLVLQGVSQTISQLKKLHKKIVLFYDIPNLGAETVGLERYCDLSSLNDCVINRDKIVNNRREVEFIISSLKTTYPDLTIFDPLDTFCDNNSCFMVHNKEMLYRNMTHLSADGSKFMAVSFLDFMTKSRAWGI